jgi:hypothetical protein
VELVYVTPDEIDPRLFDADDDRRGAVLRMALVGNRWLGGEVRWVRGAAVDGGGSYRRFEPSGEASSAVIRECRPPPRGFGENVPWLR